MSLLSWRVQCHFSIYLLYVGSACWQISKFVWLGLFWSCFFVPFLMKCSYTVICGNITECENIFEDITERHTFFFLNGCCWINGDSNDFKAQLHIILHGMDISLLIVMWIWKYIGRHVRLLPVYEKWRFSHFKICHFIFVSMYQFRITPPYQ